MKNMMKLFAVALLITAACGDDKKGMTDGGGGGGSDGGGSNTIPVAPTPGPQMDRFGRPAINTALNHGFDSNAAAAGSAKDAYNADTSSSTWAATYAGEFAKNLAIIDALDSSVTINGCGNQVLYNGMPGGGGTAGSSSYLTLAGILAADELYLDTSKGTCGLYLAVEFGVVTAMGNSTCGGRAPTYDVIDFSYSALAAGLSGFGTGFTPLVGDGVTVHTDVSDTAFPFLGAPR